ncbi:hypothetical protein VA7868_03404 [Vibrio aerogenes CECT 7868]|uniref:Uncharacterized protein n=1 Tax=Vibrio aerogenes CECT 7868 TaxID=1216006 RepID=A0A1M5ZZ48_9VIBR|nr:hypothetical protein [Vibrio aerogenes]SHI29319.1 hypothetical protein VA7868_03404 [Vibrio aerogenes CECT 7868]
MTCKKTLIAASALMASFLASAGTVSTQCSNGQFTVDLGVFSGESCSVTQTITVNGVADTTTLTVTENTKKNIQLEPTDKASASVQMSCTSAFGSGSASASASTDSGCQ